MAEYLGVLRRQASLRFIVECDRPDSQVHIARADLRDLIARVKPKPQEPEPYHVPLHQFAE